MIESIWIFLFQKYDKSKISYTQQKSLISEELKKLLLTKYISKITHLEINDLALNIKYFFLCTQISAQIRNPLLAGYRISKMIQSQALARKIVSRIWIVAIMSCVVLMNAEVTIVFEENLFPSIPNNVACAIMPTSFLNVFMKI